jgi:hypothetical protein
VAGNDGTVHEIEVTSDMVEAVTEYVTYVRGILANSYGELLVEQKFDLSHVYKGLYGSNDACIIEPFGTLHVFDYKHGKGVPVEVKRNPQLMYYGIGAMRDYEVDKVVLHICQPRYGYSEGEKFSSWETTPDDLKRFSVELRDAAKATENPDAPFVPTEKGCRFCPAAAICPALKQKAYDVAKVAFADDNAILLPTPAELSNDEIAKVLESASLLNNWVDEVQAYAHAQAEKGKKIPNYKLVAKRANRRWKDETAVVAKFGSVIDEAQLFDKKVKSPAQMEKVVGKTEVDKLTEVPSSGTSLVPEWDKRPEVRPSIEAFDTEI